MIEVAPSELYWLQRFFSGENRLTWPEIASETAPVGWLAQLLPWLRFLQKTPPQFPLVLAVFAVDGARLWYGVADDRERTTQMAEELQAFVGPSYSNFGGRLCELSPSDPLETALRERFGPLAVRLEATTIDDSKDIERQLLLYHGVLARRPPVPIRGRRPFGRVRGDFDNALLAGHAAGARRFLDELCDSGRVSAEQRKCLEIRFLAGLGRYEELARSHALITSVMDLALPPQTLVDVVDALYKTYLAPLAGTYDLNHIRETFKRHVGHSYGPLFRERRGIRQPEVLLSFLLYESSLQQPNLARCERLMQAYPDEGNARDLAQQIVDRVRRSEPVAVGGHLAEVRQAIADEDYAVAIDLCFDEIPELWAYSALLRCVVEMESAELAGRVIDLVHAADPDVHAKFSKKDRDRFDELRVLAQTGRGERHDAGWIEWARAVISQPEGFHPIKVLEAATMTWNVDDYASDADKCRTFADLVINAPSASERVFREAFPHLVQFFVDRPTKPVRAFTSIYLTLIKIIAWGGVASGDELQLSLSITEALLTAGPEVSAYCECLDDIHEIVVANRAPANLDWSLDLAELLILYPAQAPEVRLRIFMAVVAGVSAFAHRITTAQRAVLETLVRDYECPDLIATLPQSERTDRTTPAAEFAGLIAIYTLAETSGMRAKDALRQLLPRGRVELIGDTVATPRLESLAKKADLFIFAWKKSSHQAYYCVKQARGQDNVIMPTGGGAASLVRSVLDHIAGLN